MTPERCESIVSQTIANLPVRIRGSLDNLSFAVSFERRLSDAENGIRRRGVLLGLYEGVPIGARATGYQWVVPDRITIFLDVIERLTGGDDEQTEEMIGETVLHEIAHYLGFSESEVRTWERRRKQRRRSTERHSGRDA